MAEPSVCAVCLTADRQAMTERAVACFEATKYKNKSMLILDTGTKRFNLTGHHPGVSIVYWIRTNETLAMLRNIVNSLTRADILMHFDSDDHRNPESMSEMVAALLESGKQCVGYRDCLFWELYQRSSIEGVEVDGITEQRVVQKQDGRAYHWTSNIPGGVIGGSIMYWRDAWVRRRFPLQGKSENTEWLREIDKHQMRSIPEGDPIPRMIALRHGGNTSELNLEFQCENAPDAWRRSPEWDDACRKAFA